MQPARRHRTPVPLARTATWEDLEQVPELEVGEIINGELVVSPRPGFPHAQGATNLGGLLAVTFGMGIGGPGGWIILDEPYVRFGRDIRAPDIAGWRRERLVEVPDRGPIEVAPDWICEVISKSTEFFDRGEKQALYRRHGVKHLWFLNPITRTIEVFRLTPDGWLLVSVHSAEQRLRCEPFDAVEFDLALLWSSPRSEEPDDE